MVISLGVRCNAMLQCVISYSALRRAVLIILSMEEDEEMVGRH